jgi:cell division protein FtsI (penicillin-binding protein 3)
VLSVAAARSIRSMMEEVVTPQGTAARAAVPGYRVAGKTGTVKKIDAGGGYSKDRYMAVFAGIAPASDPRLVMVVMVDEPSKDVYYGGLVAAPVFGRVMAGAMRILNVPPDRIDDKGPHLASARGAP